jgi:hypothetical protein
MDKNTLEAAAREERLKYFREWRRNNADKVKKHNKNYWLKKAEKKLKEEKSRVGKQETNHADSKGNR